MHRWIDALYSHPSAAFKMNEALSPYFFLSNCTRQGCPLLPLIFVLTQEPLLCHVRANTDIKGLEVGRDSRKVTAYADDLMFFITLPETTLPVLLQEL